MDIYSPIKGKCTWWRELPNEEDAYDIRVKGSDKRVTCSCFVEGGYQEYRTSEIPADCPEHRKCRYYIRHG